MGISTMDTADRVKDFSKKYGLTYLQLLDPGAEVFGRVSEFEVIPRTILLDRRQNIVAAELGYAAEPFGRFVEMVRSLVEEEGHQ